MAQEPHKVSDKRDKNVWMAQITSQILTAMWYDSGLGRASRQQSLCPVKPEGRHDKRRKVPQLGDAEFLHAIDFLNFVKVLHSNGLSNQAHAFIT